MTIDRAIDLLGAKTEILVFTGAGISTESGIPDFRGPDGVWTKVDPAEFTIERYLSNPETRRRSWSMRAHSGVLDAKPNEGHAAVVELWRARRLLGCVTQNIDGLHAAAGLPAEMIVELHGNARETRCVECGDRTDTATVLSRVESGDEDPKCRRCQGIVKVDVVFFGEAMPEGEMMRAMAMAHAADAVIAVGSTLSVFPAAEIPLVAAEDGAPFIIINQGPTELNAAADVIIDGPAGITLGAIATSLADEQPGEP